MPVASWNSNEAISDAAAGGEDPNANPWSQGLGAPSTAVIVASEEEPASGGDDFDDFDDFDDEFDDDFEEEMEDEYETLDDEFDDIDVPDDGDDDFEDDGFQED